MPNCRAPREIPRPGDPRLLPPPAAARRLTQPSPLPPLSPRWSYAGSSVGSTNKLKYVGDKHARMQACCTACIKMSSCKIWGECLTGRSNQKTISKTNSPTDRPTTALTNRRPPPPEPAEWQGLGDGKYICKFFSAAAKRTPYRGPKGVGQMSGVVQK